MSENTNLRTSQPFKRIRTAIRRGSNGLWNTPCNVEEEMGVPLRGGWNLTSASARVSPPVPTPDRLRTALNLAKECELLPA
jgi:hypothetical protein